jgi:hypothetical protein
MCTAVQLGSAKTGHDYLMGAITVFTRPGHVFCTLCSLDPKAEGNLQPETPSSTKPRSQTGLAKIKPHSATSCVITAPWLTLVGAAIQRPERMSAPSPIEEQSCPMVLWKNCEADATP